MHNMPGIPVGQFAIRPGPAAGRQRRHPHRHHRQGRPRRPPARVHRSGAGRLPHRHRAAVDRRAQRRSAQVGRHLDLHVPCRARRSTSSRRRRSCRAPPARSTPEVRDLIERRVVEVAETTARLLRRHRQGHLRAQLSRDQQPRAADRSSRPPWPARWPAPTRSTPTSPPLMGGEDFSFMLEARPGAFIFIGNGNTAGVHHPKYDFNDDAHPRRRLLLGAPGRDGDAGVRPRRSLLSSRALCPGLRHSS